MAATSHSWRRRSYTILRRAEVQRRTGVSRSTLYALIAKGEFTKPVKLTDYAIGWPDFEPEAIIAARIAGKAGKEIRTLVDELHEARKNLMATTEDAA